ncbi:hypothetical protein ACRWQN_12625 [Shewanella sp. HL-SH8]|uniref:hypothetical protein n=1 Tax=Shewanella sp. HL-SH8 TaxID=3436242 RepID=UPI003EBD93D1
MSQTIKLNAHIYFLLIEKKLDHFTVSSLRNELQAYTNAYSDPVEARVFIYKQIRYLAKQNLLARADSPSPMRAIYSKTLLFKSSNFIRKTIKNRVGDSLFKTQSNNKVNYFEDELNQAIKTHETEMLVIASETKEYLRLMGKYTSKIDNILPLYEKGQIRLLTLKGKLVALKNLKEKNSEHCNI